MTVVRIHHQEFTQLYRRPHGCRRISGDDSTWRTAVDVAGIGHRVNRLNQKASYSTPCTNQDFLRSMRRNRCLKPSDTHITENSGRWRICP